MKQVQRG